MIYISSSCIKTQNIKDAIETLCKAGFTHIELSGGTKYYQTLEKDLVTLKNKYKLSYLMHNYFPPSKEEFVLNLSSLNNEIYEKSISHILYALKLAKRLEIDKFGFHAGFFLDFEVYEIGKKIAHRKLYDSEKAQKQFCEAFTIIKKEAKGIKLFIENNVLSLENYRTFHSQIPFMLVTHSDYLALKKYVDFELLLDVGHLKTSCNSLGIDFYPEFKKMFAETDYIHLSDNNGKEDQNKIPTKGSILWDVLRPSSLRNKTVTLELYDDIERVKIFYLFLKN